MNYKYHYDKLIETRKDLSRFKGEGVYYERHHIVPRSMGGSDDPDNLILLTGREHYIAHLLLWKIYPESFAMQNAFMIMCNKKVSKVNSRIYDKLKSNFSKYMTETRSGENNHRYGVSLPEWQKEAIRKAQTGRVQSPETIAKRVSKTKGKKRTEEQKAALSLALKSLNRKLSEETKQLLSEKAMGRRYSDDSYARGAAKRAEMGYTMSEEARQRMSEEKKGIPRSKETVEKMKIGMRKYNYPWTNRKHINTEGYLEKWVNADYFYNFWVLIGKPGKRNLAKAYNDSHNDSVPLYYFESLIKKFKVGWIPKQDEDWLKFKENYYA